MDLHLLDAAPTAAERAAVDHVLGPPRRGWDGGARDAGRARATRCAHGGHEARARRHLLLPALLARAGARRLDQPGRAQPHLPSG